MKRFPKATWIGVVLFDLVGFAAIIAALTGEAGTNVVTLITGVALMACSGLLFVIRMPALLLAGLTAGVLLMQYAPAALASADAPAGWPAQALTAGGVLVLFFAAAALGGQSAASGGC